MSAEPAAGASRPRRLPRAERELQMLEVASRLFAAQGFEATSMDGIARACGVTKPMLYAYFGSKQGLYEALIARSGRHLLGMIMTLQQERDPEQRLRRGIRLLIEFVDRHRDSWRMVFDSSEPGRPQTRPGDIAGYRRQILIALTFTLQELRPAGVGEADAEPMAHAYARLMLGAAEAGAQWWLHTPGVAVEAVYALSEQVLTGLLPQARLAMAAGVTAAR